MAHNLPVQLTSFVGREREIAQVKRLLSSARLLTLTGAGGVGKTRLAYQVAAAALGDYRDGVWVVDLAPLADPALVPQAAASALSVMEQPGRPLAETLAEAVREKALLLVLDNCEHLQGACAGLVTGFLRGGRGVRILATSRVPLSMAGEMLWRVPSLTLPEAGREPASGVEEYESVRLFVERARAGRSGFALAPGNAGAVVKVCQRLDGIPLAIELAAARTRVMAVEQIAARLDDRFRLLTGASTSTLPRHQTLLATMEWSYGLLAEGERVLLRRLAVFAGGWTLEAAEAICAGDGVAAGGILDLMTQLLDKSLVAMEERRGEARYRLLETVRQYGRDRLEEAGEAAAVRRLHRDWYVDLAEQADAKLYGPEQELALARLEAEHDNFRAALEWSRSAKDGAPASLRLAGALGWFWYLHGHWSEGRAWLEEALGRGADVAPSLLPKALLGAGRITWFQGSQATPLFEKGLAVCRELGDVDVMPGFLYWVGRQALGRGDIQRAEALLEEGLSLCRVRGDTWWASQLLAERGNLEESRGDYGRAAALYGEGLALSRQRGAINNTMLFLHNLGLVALYQGDVSRATACYGECLALTKKVKHRLIAAGCLEGFARAAAAQGDHRRAARLFGAGGALEEALGRKGRGSVFAGAEVDFDQSDHDRRVKLARAGLGEAGFAAALSEGRAMTLEQATDYALAATDALSSKVQEKERLEKAGTVLLTAREHEVATLVAQGLTNRQIAARLVITERTAETHVQNILNKLGFTSRAQIAAWAAQRGLRLPTKE